MADSSKSVSEQFMDMAAKLYRVPRVKISANTSLDTDLYSTSLHYYGMISIINGLSGKTVSYPRIRECHSIGDVLNLLNSLLDSGKSGNQK
jgi:hypothetical protein